MNMNDKADTGMRLLVFAWTVEIIGALAGILNALYTTFGNNFPTTVVGYIPAVPMAVLAVAEVGRIPLASVIYTKHAITRGVAIFGILALAYLAVENWTFGFERIVDLRLAPVNAATGVLKNAQDELAALNERLASGTKSGGDNREELRRGVTQRDASIKDLTAQIAQEAGVHQKNLQGIKDACRLVAERCIVPRSRDEDSRYKTEVDRLSTELAGQREARKDLLTQIEELAKRHGDIDAELQAKIAAAGNAVTTARAGVRQATDANQIYRLAASWYRVSTDNVTAAQFAAARWVFATFSAVAVALAGTVAALVFYATNRIPGAPSMIGRLIGKVTRARRAYYARLRKPIKVEVPVIEERVVYREGKEPAPPPTVVEKIIDRPIEHIVLVPRPGVRFPIHINSLIRGRKRTADGAAAASPDATWPS